MSWGNGPKFAPKCQICKDDGKPCNRCGQGFKDGPRKPLPKPAQGSLTIKDLQSMGIKTLPSQSASSLSLSTGFVGAAHPTKGCVHDAQTPAFTLCSGTKRIYGARGSRLNDPTVKLAHLDTILDLAGLVKPTSAFIKAGSSRIFANLNKAVYPEVVKFDWPDMTAPNHVRLEFWARLLRALKPDTAIACMGSHGRTGTAMAALLVADGMSARQAIDTVREKHCKHAIETAAQEAYIARLEAERNKS